MFCDTTLQWVAKGSCNHMCLTGVEIDETNNAGGFIEAPDQMAVELFGMGIVNELGGQDLQSFLSSVAKNVRWSSLTMAPAYIGLSSSGDVVLYFIMDPDSDVGNVYTDLCSGYGNSVFGGSATYMENYCARSLVTDSAYNGCWAADPNYNPYSYQEAPSDGGFCLFATIMLGPVFYSTEAQEDYLQNANDQLDTWRTNMQKAGKQASFTPQSDGNFCNGKPSCLAFFFGRSAPYAALDGQGNVYYYDNDFLSGSNDGTYDNGNHNNGNDGNSSGDEPIIQRLFELTINALGIGLAAFFSVLMLRKYRRRRRKGLSNYEIFFGSSRKRWRRKTAKYKKSRDKREKQRKENSRGRTQDRSPQRSSKKENLLDPSPSGRRSKSPTRFKWIDGEEELRGSYVNPDLPEVKAQKSSGFSFGFQNIVAKNLKKQRQEKQSSKRATEKPTAKKNSKRRSGTGEEPPFRTSPSKDRSKSREKTPKRDPAKTVFI